MKGTIILGTRGSKLALIQTDIVKNKLLDLYTQLTIEIKIISTKGDRDKKSQIPLDTVGKDWFSKELDSALLNGTIDLAVHSLKDIPEDFSKELTIAAIPQREDAREALVSYNNVMFENLKKRAIIGTDSTRRKSQLLHKRPDLVIKSVRGNVDTRLEKVKNHDYDALLLAVAGLKRLGLEKSITEYFSETDIVPSPGQGALAVVVRKDNKELLKNLKRLNHSETVKAVKAERSFSKIFGGGCSMPIGAYAICKKDNIVLHGMVGSLDGRHVIKKKIQGNSSKPVTLGKELGLHMIKKRPYIVITCPEKKKSYLMKNITNVGLQSFFYPTIEIKKVQLSKDDQKILKNLEDFDWIIFTSKNGIKYFMQALTNFNTSLLKTNKTKIAVVGERTAKLATDYGLRVSFHPKKFTAKNLTLEMKNIKNKKILLVQGNLSSPLTQKKLQEKTANVVSLIVYKTEFPKKKNKELEEMIDQQQIAYLTFTSPSTVKGFIKSIKSKSILSLPVISIGPVTTKELKKYGFKTIYTADTFTEEGMYIKLKEILV